MNKWQNTRRAVIEHMHFRTPLLSEELPVERFEIQNWEVLFLIDLVVITCHLKSVIFRNKKFQIF